MYVSYVYLKQNPSKPRKGYVTVESLKQSAPVRLAEDIHISFFHKSFARTTHTQTQTHTHPSTHQLAAVADAKTSLQHRSTYAKLIYCIPKTFAPISDCQRCNAMHTYTYQQASMHAGMQANINSPSKAHTIAKVRTDTMILLF